MQNIRIIVLFGNVPLYGSERANIETLDLLQQRGARVLFLIRKEWTDQTIQPELRHRNLSFLFVPYYDTIRHGTSLRIWMRNILGILGGSIALIRQIYRFKATHIHIGSTAWVLNFFPALLLTRLPLIFRVGDIPPLHHPLYEYLWKYTCQRVSAFVCNSHFVRNTIISLGASSERCTVAYMPPPSRVERHDIDLFKLRSFFSSEKLTLAYVGQISRHKGVDILIDAFLPLAQRGDCRLVVVGNYSWRNPLGETLVKQISDLNLEHVIWFTGFLHDIKTIYEHANVHVVPSVWQEPYGGSVMEAKNYGIPSIAFPLGGLVELVQHGVEGWVCREPTVEALREAIQHYLDTPEDVIKHGRAAKTSLTERLRVQDYAQHWEDIYVRYT